MVIFMDEKTIIIIKNKKNPTPTEKYKLIRFYVNVLKMDTEKIYSQVPQWKKEDVDKIVKEVEAENLKPTPKRYYVSLKEPMDEMR